MPVSPVPPGYHTLMPYRIVDGGARALAWYAEAFGARERTCAPMPGGIIGHAEIEIGDSCVMLAGEHPAIGAKGPGAFGGSPVSLHLYVPDVDAVMAKAVAAGATVKNPAEDKSYGDRTGSLVDPFGHVWHIATHVEDVTEAEIGRRMAALPARA